MKITLLDQTPAKKNARIGIVRNGRVMNFPSKAYKSWQQESLWQLKGLKEITEYPVAVWVTFYMKDNRKRDLDNMLSSVLDVLQDSGILKGDDWKHVYSIMITSGGVDPQRPRAEIKIEPL